VAGAQALLTALATTAFGLRDGPHAALAAAYGGAVAMLISAWLGWCLRRAAGWAALYSGAALRYAAAIALLALGLGALQLAPLPLVAAFGVAQFGFLADLRRARRDGGSRV
jgi:ATP synthase protein I